MPRKQPARRRKVRDPFAPAAPITQEILQHHRAAGAASVDARAEQGALLVEARKVIPHGAWGPYVAQKLPFSVGTAKRAINLHHFRTNHPALFDDLRPLGLGVATFLINRPVAEIAAFLSKPHLVPSLGVEKTPSAMTLPQVMEVVLGPPEPDDDLAELLLTRSRRAGRRAIQEIEALIDNRDALDPDDVEDLYDDLMHAIAALGAAYGLEDH